jgi:P-type Ca2+ transporter type 2C
VSVPEGWRADPEALAARLGVDLARGLDETEATTRLQGGGANRLPEPEPIRAWRRLVAQLRDPMILILLAAAVVGLAATREVKTPAFVLAVVTLNAVLGFVQENRAEASLAALRRMLVTQARVRRDGELRVVAAEQLVPGDVVLLEAGDRIPADGRFVEAVQLEASEASLTGESQPVPKHTAPLPAEVLPVGERSNMGHLNTTVTRGRGVLLVTATGPRTEMGRLAGLLQTAKAERTPLQQQLGRLAHSLARLALVIVALVVAIGAARGQAFGDLLMTAVALAVATIPEGLPAVTAVTLAVGVGAMARRHAIVKQLASVETLGCTSVICSDKTGTLTRNEMTATDVIVSGRRIRVTGQGYDPAGAIGAGEEPPPALQAALVVAALCNDASVRSDDGGGWDAVGDPTEAALVVLARKGGIDVDAERRAHPRRAELPFDSARKLMATVHDLGSGADPDVRLLVKGAPDVLLPACPGAGLDDHNRDLADRGLRVLALAERRLSGEEADRDPEELLEGLTLLALVGIADQPRPEAAAAIAEAVAAGVTVKMITGDHAATAATIGRQLGLGGPDGAVAALTGSDLDRLDDAELRARLPATTVFARVSPEHKLRLVHALQADGHVVAMTGDGVNDAPALKRADIGIAMGVTGTEVTKEAAAMVLADDNFATIVTAVRRGRTIYDNIVKFVRFQLSTTLGFAALFLAAATLGIAGGKPFTAIAILWVNIIMDGPPAMALGVDPDDEDVMRRRPRPRSEGILTRDRWVAIVLAAVTMAAVTLGVLAWAPGPAPAAGVATVAGTMAFTTFVLCQFFNILNARSDRQSVFRRQTLANRPLWLALAGVALLQVTAVELAPLRTLFDTTAISGAQWLVCVAVASSVLWVEELRKLSHRWRANKGVGSGDGTAPEPAMTAGPVAAGRPSLRLARR